MDWHVIERTVMAEKKKPRAPRPDVTIRYMNQGDIAAVGVIDRASFAAEWSEVAFTANLKSRKLECWVAEVEGKVAGFAICMSELPEYMVLLFAVAPRMRRKGVGRSLFEWLYKRAKQLRKPRCSLGVPETNLDAQLFMKAIGFKAFRISKLAHFDRMKEEREDLFYFRFPAEFHDYPP